MKRFESKVVLVLGGNSGIGRAAAEAFAREGAKVVVAARREAEGVAVVQAIQKAGGRAKFIRADVASEADVKAVVDGTVKEFGQLDVLINNAGIEGKMGPIGVLTAADFEETFGVNVKGTWLAMKHALPHLVKTKGTIVNNGSVVGEVGFPDASIYSATKGAVHALTRAAAMSSTTPGVPTGTACFATARTASRPPKTRAAMSVSMGPGATALTRTPWEMNSIAAARVRACTAPLVAE